MGMGGLRPRPRGLGCRWSTPSRSIGCRKTCGRTDASRFQWNDVRGSGRSILAGLSPLVLPPLRGLDNLLDGLPRVGISDSLALIGGHLPGFQPLEMSFAPTGLSAISPSPTAEAVGYFRSSLTGLRRKAAEGVLALALA